MNTPTPRANAVHLADLDSLDIRYDMMFAKAEELETELTAMTKHRDEWEAKYSKEATDNMLAINKIAGERDRLADASRELCVAFLLDNPRDITKLLNKVGEALQSLNQPTETKTK